MQTSQAIVLCLLLTKCEMQQIGEKHVRCTLICTQIHEKKKKKMRCIHLHTDSRRKDEMHIHLHTDSRKGC